ncbi:MAG TPA: histidine kinase N-terminal 7TM domain-containing protein [Bacillota bacterium]|nr:histidine kinase N-terminal 7TM domain-containing protein [Bacillota bacterium]
MQPTPLSIYDPNVILSFLPAILSVFIIGYCLLKGRKTPLLYSYLLVQTLFAIWTTAHGWAYLANSRLSLWLSDVLLFIGTCYIGPAWLCFCGLYTGIPIISKKRNIWLLFGTPFLLYLSILINDYHHILRFGTYYLGILYWFHVAVAVIYGAIGIIMMIKYAITQMSDSRSQSILLIFSVFSPLLGSLLDQVQLIKNNPMPFTSYSLSISMLLLGVVSFKYRFLNIIPVAWQKIMNHMKESMLIIDRNDTVVNYNHSFEINFPEFIQTGASDPIAFSQHLNIRSDGSDESNRMINAIQHGAKDTLSGELTLITPVWKCFSVYIQPILSQRGEIQGRIVLFNDITHDKMLLQELHDRNDIMSAINQELAAANEQLKDYARTMEELAVTQERNRIAQDIHDSVGHQMTLLIALLEVTTDLYCQNRPETKAKLREAIMTARESLQELRHSIRHQTEIQDLLESLQKLIANFEASGIHIDFSAEGTSDDLHPKTAEVLYRICQEALTNAVRHGKAKRAIIVLRFNLDMLSLDISDNGQGCQTITKGMGLMGMEARVKELNGTIEYGGNGEGGFRIKVEIPVILLT